MTDPRTVLCIVGPTGCSKTAVSIRLAELLDGEIVSADAVAVFHHDAFQNSLTAYIR